MAVGADAAYDGSRIFTWVSDLSGLPIDQVNFLISQFLALLLAPLFRNVLHPSCTSPATRHAVGLYLGLTLGYFCFGSQAIHLAGLPSICYIVMRTQKPQIMQMMVLAVSLVYLSYIHLQRQLFNYGSYTLDITGPLMVITQKVTSLAFSLHDGITKKEEEMTSSQKYHAVRKMPTPLEYFSYVFHFHALMAGPVVFYKDYIDFITGQNFLRYAPPSAGTVDSNSNSSKIIVEPSPNVVIVKKVVSGLLCALVFVNLIPFFPIERVKEDDFVEGTSLLHKSMFLIMATSLVRFKYYHAWLLADGICNASGLGFNGYNADGSAKWDLISNVEVLRFELGLSLRDCIDAWNKGTTRWLRFLVYERAPYLKTVLTYGLSSLWHGFYPGYYLTFMTGALFTFAGRMVRKCIRQYFLDSKFSKTVYDIITLIFTRVLMGYVTFSFVLLEFWPSLRLYIHMYLWLHVLAVLSVTLLPVLCPPRRAEKTKFEGKGVQNGSVTS